MININGKEYRNIQEQVEKNQEDIQEIKKSTIEAYSKTEADDKFETISDVYGNFYTRDQSDARFPTETHMNLLLGYKQDKLTAGNNITIDANNVISAAGGSGSTYTAGNGIDITNNVVSIDSTKVLTVDNENTLSRSMIIVPEISSLAGEDSDNKGNIYLNSGVRNGSVQLEADGEESGASLRVRGTSAVGSEGMIEINGQTTINTANRINVVNGSNTEQIAYLSDLQSLIDRVTALEQQLQNNNN